MVIFDCDGVLVDSEAITNGVLSEMLGEVGLPLTVEESMQLFNGGSLESVMAYVRDQGHRVPDDFASRFRQRTFARYRGEMRPIDGVRSVVDWLVERQRPHCVASSGPQEKIELNLRVADLWPYFAGRTFSSYDIGVWKPKPDIFLHAAEQMGSEPDDCVVIEDSVVGVRAGVAAGMSVLAYSPEADPVFASLGARVFRHMSELPQLLS